MGCDRIGLGRDGTGRAVSARLGVDASAARAGGLPAQPAGPERRRGLRRHIRRLPHLQLRPTLENLRQQRRNYGNMVCGEFGIYAVQIYGGNVEILPGGSN